MEITVYAKKRTTREGKTFYVYLSRLMKKDGTEVTAAVKFRDNGCGMPRPEDCPCNIVVEKDNCNFTTRTFVSETSSDLIVSNTLWVSAWVKGSDYVDTSMDDFI